jgi:hypothetical protein
MGFLLSGVHWRLRVTVRWLDARFHLLPRNPEDGNEGASRNRTSTFLLRITKAGLTAETPPASPWLCIEESAPAP